LLTTENHFSEKAEPTADKVSWRKRRLWGKVPMGVALVVLVLILVFSVALGAAIGTFAAKKHSKDDENEHDGPHEEA
jgi:flagellar basal body-associated protein FliL